jgi:hypothetical protein
LALRRDLLLTLNFRSLSSSGVSFGFSFSRSLFLLTTTRSFFSLLLHHYEPNP